MTELEDHIEEQVNELLDKFSYENKLTKDEIEERVIVSVYPIGESMKILIIKYGEDPIGSVLDMGDYIIATSYNLEVDSGKGNDNRH